MNGSDKNFARIAIGWKWLHQNVVNLWAKEQENGRYCPLSRWLLKKKYLSARQIATIMRGMSQDTRLSTITSSAQEFDAIGRYRIIDKIGQGGMGVVYRVRDSMLDRVVALKILKDSGIADDSAQKRFQREAKLMGGMQHLNIIKIYDVGRQENLHYFAMEYIDGETLESILARNIPVFTLVSILVKICDAVNYAHQRGIIHRDLKPANIMIDSDFEPKVMDFGLGKKIEDSGKISRSGEILGTLEYMAPEQADGNVTAIDAQSDVYALGAILYRMLTGRPPFSGNTAYQILWQIASREPVLPTRINSELPKALESICLKALEKEKTRRYASAAKMAADLQAYLQGEPVAAAPVTAFSRAWKWCRSHYILAAVSWIVVLTVIALSTMMVINRESYIKRINQKNVQLAASNKELNRQKQELNRQKQDLTNKKRLLEQQKIELRQQAIDSEITTSAMQIIVAAFYGKRYKNYYQLGQWCQQAEKNLNNLAKKIMDLGRSPLPAAAQREWLRLHHRQRMLQRFSMCLARFGQRSSWQIEAYSSPHVRSLQPSLRFAVLQPANAATIVYDRIKKQRLHTFSTAVQCAAVSADDTLIAIGDSAGNVKIGQIGAGRYIHQVSFSVDQRKPSPVLALKFAPQRQELLAATQSRLIIWQLSTNKIIFSHEHFSRRINCAFSDSGNKVAIAGSDFFWVDLSTAKVLQRLPNRMGALCFDHRSHNLLAAENNVVYRYNFTTSERKLVVSDHESEIQDIAASADGRFLAMVDRSGKVTLRDGYHYGKIWEAPVTGNINGYHRVLFDRRQSKISVFNYRAINRYGYERQGGKILGLAAVLPDYARSLASLNSELPTAGRQKFGTLALAPDASYLACYAYPYLYLWHKKTKNFIRLHHHSLLESLKKMSFSSDGSLLLWCGKNQALIWRVQDQKLVYSARSGKYTNTWTLFLLAVIYCPISNREGGYLQKPKLASTS